MQTTKKNQTKRNLYLDVVLVLAFLVSLKPFLTGLAIHEWLGLTICGGLMLHIIWHWKWMVSVTSKLLGRLLHKDLSAKKLSNRLYIYYGLDALLMVAFATIIGTGVAMSHVVLPTFGVLGASSFALAIIHKYASYLTLVLVVVKLIGHRKWLQNAFKRHYAKQHQFQHQPQVERTVPQSLAFATVQGEQPKSATTINRRHFLVLGCGAVCAAAVAGVCKGNFAQLEQDADSNEVVSSINIEDTQAETTTEAVTSHEPRVRPQRGASSSAQSQCHHGMVDDPYPGQCHHYIDTNNNGYCDLSQVS
jgi:hypothetical protein